MPTEILNIGKDSSSFGSRVSDRMIAGAASASLIFGTGFVAYFDPTKATFFPVCPLLALTGFACPGCGLTRGFHSLLHGDLIAAVDYNALILVWAAIIGWAVIALGLIAIRGRGIYMWPTKPRFMMVFAAVLLTFGILRNIPAWPLTILYP